MKKSVNVKNETAIVKKTVILIPMTTLKYQKFKHGLNIFTLVV